MYIKISIFLIDIIIIIIIIINITITNNAAVFIVTIIAGATLKNSQTFLHTPAYFLYFHLHWNCKMFS